jgi:hypothetical protein
VAAGWVLAAAWLERGEQSPFIRTARRGIPTTVSVKEEVMFVIGIDPHKRSHTVAVLDDTEELVGQVRVNADRWQRDRLLRFAAPFEPHTSTAEEDAAANTEPAERMWGPTVRRLGARRRARSGARRAPDRTTFVAAARTLASTRAARSTSSCLRHPHPEVLG